MVRCRAKGESYSYDFAASLQNTNEQSSPIATAAPKQSNCLLVRLNITLLLILVKSFGTVTYAISNLLSGKPYVAFDFISPYVPTRGMLPCKQFNTR